MIVQFLNICVFICRVYYISYSFIPLSSDLALSEENAGQRLLDMENHKKQRALEHDKVEKQLRQYTAKNQIMDSELQYPLSVLR